jgi:energy-converting hydrogenase A subunit R
MMRHIFSFLLNWKGIDVGEDVKTRQFNTDCEGPISKNDNAMELAASFIPDGGRFFSLISKYDDFLADVEKMRGYKAGDTLKLILPFLKAHGLTTAEMVNYSRRNILLVQGAVETLQFVNRLMPSFIVSTSYEPYLQALCTVVRFPMDHVYCTRVNIDAYLLGKGEEERLRSFASEIARMKMINWGDGAMGIEDLSAEDQGTVRRLHHILWEEIAEMEIGRVFKEVNPVGGVEKANAILDSLKRTETGLADVIYVGDSITDVQAFKLVRDGGGVAVSFNGNGYALRSADICCISNDTVVLSLLASSFSKGGRDRVLALAEKWSRSSIEERGVEEELKIRLQSIADEDFPRMKLIAESNIGQLIEESEGFRKQVRGVEIGSLG